MLVLDSVIVSYGKKVVLNGVSLALEKGEQAAVLGGNGAGKSTLLRAAAGVSKANKGTVTINGVPVNKKHAQRILGYVPQENIVFDELSVKDNLKFWSAANGVRYETLKTENHIMALLGVDDIYKERTNKLSGGMKRRLSIACALMHDPQMLILDEPFSGIDSDTVGRLLEYFNKLKLCGKTMIITSHNPAELERLCDSFYYLKEGKLQLT